MLTHGVAPRGSLAHLFEHGGDLGQGVGVLDADLTDPAQVAGDPTDVLLQETRVPGLLSEPADDLADPLAHLPGGRRQAIGVGEAVGEAADN